MRKLLASILILSQFACKNMNETNTQLGIAPITKERIANAVIYEANIRQYSPEGSFKAFTADLPKIKELGVDIIWLMPIYPISTKNSKGSLGSYYAVSDFTQVNPEFGTMEDVKELIDQAHSLDMYVILDWVPNHTGWDHIWLTDHPEWYTQDEQGNPTHPVGTDWTDTADLNYDNLDMRAQMLSDMKSWIVNADIDGFRCDMAGMVPHDFWVNTIAELRALKPIFMMAEAWEPHLLEAGFEMVYGWDRHHLSNDLAQQSKSLDEWKNRIKEDFKRYPNEGIVMNFTSNHDENSWNGTVKERLGDAIETIAALMYTSPGMPLIYSGQEYDLDKRLLFFEKDTIDKTKGQMFEVYKKLGELKNATSALDVGANAASYSDLENSRADKVLSFKRTKGNDELVFVANLSDQLQKVSVFNQGEYTDYMRGTTQDISQEMELQAWEYRIYLNK